MTLRRFAVKFLKITGIATGILLLLLTAFHFWFIRHAKGLLEDMVTNKSGGRISLKVEKLRYNYFTHRMTIKKAVIVNTDTATASSAYRFSIPEMRIQLDALLPFILHKELLIDSLHLQAPAFQVTRLRFSADSSSRRKKVSIPHEMGKVYHSIQDALQVLQVTRFQMDEGSFTLLNRAEPDQAPLTVDHLHLHLDNIRVDTTRQDGPGRLFFSDNLVIRSRDQRIVFPDKRHKLNFSHFRINLRQRLVEFDSCTIEALRPDSTTGSFRVFFDALYLTNIDFDTLYQHDVIKADSVYCINPRFALRADLDRARASQQSVPSLKSLIEQLTGNLSLNYVVVANADFDIRTRRNGVFSSYIFNRNTFEMQGLTIEQGSRNPIRVQNFAMAIRNYENFIRDSTYSVTFDSVLFKNDRVILSNFVLKKFIRGRTINTFRMPYFSLEGLSWDQLVFEKKINARRAGMYSPAIQYTYNRERLARGEKRSLFRSLGLLDEYMDLGHLDIENGNLNLELSPRLRVKLEGASLSVRSQSLLSSKEISGLRNSLENIRFRNGQVRSGDIEINLGDFEYEQAGGLLRAGEAGFTKQDGSLAAQFRDLSATELIVDERTGQTKAGAIQWASGKIDLNLPRERKKALIPVMDIRNISGGPTLITAGRDTNLLTTRTTAVKASQFLAGPAQDLVISGLSVSGDHLDYRGNGLRLHSGGYQVTDGEASLLNQLMLSMTGPGTETRLEIPYLKLVPDIAAILGGHYRFSSLEMEKPLLLANVFRQRPSGDFLSSGWPAVYAGDIILRQPVIRLEISGDSSHTTVHWKGANDTSNRLLVAGLTIQEGRDGAASADYILLQGDSVRVRQTGKNKFDTKDIQLNASLGLTLYSRPASWSTTLQELKTGPLRFDSLGKKANSLNLTGLHLKNLVMNDKLVRDAAALTAGNKRFLVSGLTGDYTTAETSVEFSNLGFDRRNDEVSIDSFRIMPRLPLDSFLATRSFQQDYLLLHSDAARIGPVDIETYLLDGSLHIHKASFDSLFLKDYKDKNLPPKPERVKPLPVNLLKRIGIPLAIDSVILQNSVVDYTEVNEKTKVAGNITVNRMHVELINVKNHGFEPGDSLFLRANGYLLDTVWTRLRVKESYTDSQAGFVMTLRMKAGDLRVLNRSLVPLANVKLLSGEVDTLSMRAVGREFLAFGEMTMFYRKLKIQLLPSGTDTRQPFLSRLTSSLANALVIRNSNHSRKGVVFYIRNRDKSAINYLIRTAISGMASSVGVKRYKRLLRRYQKELEKNKLPPLEW